MDNLINTPARSTQLSKKSTLPSREDIIKAFFDLPLLPSQSELWHHRQQMDNYYAHTKSYLVEADELILKQQLGHVGTLLDWLLLDKRSLDYVDGAEEPIQLILSRLKNIDHWDAYDLQIMSMAITYHVSAKAALRTLDRCEQALIHYEDQDFIERLRLRLYVNLSTRLLHFRFHGESLAPDALKASFHHLVDKAIALCESQQQPVLAQALQVRKALADNHGQELLAHLKKLQAIAPHSVYRDVLFHVRHYRALVVMPAR